ncbi:MAG TPA: glycosyltransferase [bacterium]|nr:glycosyltransferase [bacterium]
MKIALLGPDPSFKGGIGQYNHFLAQEIRKEGHELLFVGFLRQYPKFLYPPGTGDSIHPQSSGQLPATGGLPPSSPDAGEAGGVSAVTMPAYTVERILSWDRPFSWMAAAKRIESFSPDVMVVPWWTFFWYPWFGPLMCRLRRFRRVVIAHNASDHEGHGLRGAASRFATRRILAAADRVIVQSAEEKEKVAALGARETVVIHHPVYPQFRTTLSRAEAREKFGIAPDARVALLFGALRPYKGADLFAQAIAEHPDITGIIAGEIWDEALGAQLRGLAARHPNLRLLDRYFDDDEGALLFAACDAVVLPYRSVTGSGAAMAALGAGKPLVAADLPLFREIFPAQLATFFTPGDTADLARALNDFFTVRNKLQSEEALAIISERFGWDRLVWAVTGTMKTDVKN